jgi:hypothetical protein
MNQPLLSTVEQLATKVRCDHLSSDDVDRLRALARSTFVRHQASDDDLTEVVAEWCLHALIEREAPADELLRELRRLCQRQKREAVRGPPTGAPPPPPTVDPHEQLCARRRRQAHLAERAAQLRILEPIVLRAIEGYRVDRRALAHTTWELWLWQRNLGGPYRDVCAVVARAFHGMRDRDRRRWVRHRDRLMRRRSRLRQALRDTIAAAAADGTLSPATAHGLLHDVLPWLSGAPARNDPTLESP